METDEYRERESEQPLPNALVGPGSGVGRGDSGGSLRIEWPTVTDDAEAQERSRECAGYLMEQEKDAPKPRNYDQIIAWARAKGYVTQIDMEVVFKIKYSDSRTVLAWLLRDRILDPASMRRIRRENGRMADGWRVKDVGVGDRLDT